MSHSLPYLLGILLVVFVIDFTLRALPFKILEPLRAPKAGRSPVFLPCKSPTTRHGWPLD